MIVNKCMTRNNGFVFCWTYVVNKTRLDGDMIARSIGGLANHCHSKGMSKEEQFAKIEEVVDSE